VIHGIIAYLSFNDEIYIYRLLKVSEVATFFFHLHSNANGSTGCNEHANDISLQN